MTATQDGFGNLSPRLGYLSEEKKGLGSITPNEPILPAHLDMWSTLKKKCLGKYRMHLFSCKAVLEEHGRHLRHKAMDSVFTRCEAEIPSLARGDGSM